MQDVQLLVMPQGFISQCPDLNRSKSINSYTVKWKVCFVSTFCPTSLLKTLNFSVLVVNLDMIEAIVNTFYFFINVRIFLF